MAITDGFAVFKDLFQDTFSFNVFWIVSVILTFLTLLIITRDYNKWPKLALPVMVGWHLAGVRPSIIVYIILAILYAVFVVSNVLSSGLLGAVTKPITEKSRLRKRVATSAYLKSQKDRLYRNPKTTPIDMELKDIMKLLDRRRKNE